jgi:hypothetical protein
VAVIDDAARWSLSVHEAGHAVAAVLLGRRVDVVSVTIRHSSTIGVCHHGRPEALDREQLGRLHGPILRMDMQARLLFEADLAVVLAGPIAEATYTAPVDKHPYDTTDEQAVRELLARRERLPAEARGLLERTEATDSPERDLAVAYRLSLLASTDASTADLLFAWLVAEVRQWILDKEFRVPLRAISLALYEAGELDGETATQIILNPTKEVARAA